MTAQLTRDCRGVAYLEFLIILMPFLALFLGSLQLALIGAAKLVVQHAASSAARAAAVVLDDDPARYGDEERNRLQEKSSGSQNGRGTKIAEKIEEWVAWARENNDTWQFHLHNGGSERLSDIRYAAYVPLSALSPQPDRVVAWFKHAFAGVSGDTIISAIGNIPETRLLTGLLAYNRVGAAITFPTAPEANDLRADPATIAADEKQLTVRVTYLFHCGVPLVSALMCKSLWQISGLPDAAKGSVEHLSSVSIADAADPGAVLDEVRGIVGSATQAFAELSHAEVPWLQYALFATQARFFVARAEAVVPNQGAAYKYASQL
jgi:Flp pilus assembly protein TadG